MPNPELYDDADNNTTSVNRELLRLRTKRYAYSLVQYTGWLIAFYGIHQFIKPVLLLQGYDISLPAAVANALPALPFFEAIVTLIAGLAIIWISTASWF